MKIKNVIKVGFIVSIVSGLCMSPEIFPCEAPALRRSEEVPPQARLSSDTVMVNALVLYSGIMVHAINTMSGTKQSLIRKGFIPMLCYTMRIFIKSHYALQSGSAADKRDICCGLVEGLGAYASGLPDRSGFLLETVKAEIKKRLLCCLGAGSMIADVISWEKETVQAALPLIDAIMERCRDIPDLSVRLAPGSDFMKCMSEAKKRCVMRLQSRSGVRVENCFLLLQKELYGAVAESEPWGGFVHHFMVQLFHTELAAAYADDSKLFLWTDFSPLSDYDDFFTSPEYREGFQNYLREVPDPLKFSPLFSLRRLREPVDSDDSDGSDVVTRSARAQREMVKMHPASFMRSLLHAFALFHQRLSTR